jgi:hypothetical protein
LKQQIIVYSKLMNTVRDAAQSLGMIDRLGAIGQGKIVDLILLEADPLENVENNRRIAAAVVGGKLLPKEALKEMMVDAEATIANRERRR